MPHFVIDCSKNVIKKHDVNEINKRIYRVALSTGLFEANDIKVRVNAYDQCLVGNNSEDFIHIFAHIMEGRTDAQKAELSESLVMQLARLFPSIKNLAMSVSEFEKSTYRHINELVVN